MSLRQAYARVGIATEPKTPSKRPVAHKLPAHIVLAGKLVRALKRRPGKTVEEQVEGYRLDLRTLYEKLRPWFESPPMRPSQASAAAPRLWQRGSCRASSPLQPARVQ
jgi:hypothetical protein